MASRCSNRSNLIPNVKVVAILALNSLLAYQSFSSTNDPPLAIPSRSLETNGSTVFFQDRSRLPATPHTLASPAAPPDAATLVTNFFAAGWDEYFPACCYFWDGIAPPDTQGAAGTNKIMTMLNSEVRVQNRDGSTNGGYRMPLLDWWTNSVTGVFGVVFDPRLIYDPFEHRWIAVVATERRDTNNVSLLLAVSRSADPSILGTNGWNFVRVKADTNNPPRVWLDQPTVGFNKYWIVVHGNMRLHQNIDSTLPMSRSHFWVFDRTNLYAGGTNHALLQFTNTLFSGGILPAFTHDTNLATMYLLQNANGSNGWLRMFSITGAVDSPTLNHATASDARYIPKSDYSWTDFTTPVTNAEVLRQTNAHINLNAVDSRLLNVVYRNGHLWTTHHVLLPANTNNPNRAAVQWWKINPTNASVVQFQRLEGEHAGISYAFPSIGVNKYDDVLIGYAAFSPTNWPRGNFSFRAFHDDLNTLRPYQVLKESVRVSTNSTRWGDYTATMPDPINDTDFWTIQQTSTTNAAPYEYPESSGAFATWWGHIKMTLPSNDYFTNATVLNALSGSLTNHNYRGSKEAGETNHAGVSGGASLWYQWTPTNSGQAYLEALGIGVNTLLGVYTGSSVSALTLTGSDDHSNGVTRVLFNATAQTAYRIAVDGFNGGSGGIVLNWSAQLAPGIVQQPQSTNVIANANEDASFSVAAYGFLPLSYQWRQEGTNIPDAMANTLTRNNVQLWHATNYTVVVTNNYGSVTSTIAGLFVHGDSAARMSLVQRNATSFWFHVYGVTNRPYRVETSTNLISATNWYSIYTNWTSFWYTNWPITNDKMRFYRVSTNT